jgi:hypothetical protein
MTGEGRTSWWPCDAAEHDRELIVELGEEFGPGGPLAMRVLKDLAQQQRDGGRVRTGFRVLRQKTFVESIDVVRAIVEHAASIGALDDLELDEDGRRFTCRVSGWMADQARGRAAIKKASQRERGDEPVTPEGDASPSGVDTSTRGRSRGDVSGFVSPTRDDQNREEGTTSVEPRLDEPDPEVARLSHLLADLITINDPKASSRVKPDSRRWLTAMRLLIADRDGDVAEVERILRWSQTDPFWQTNILSPTKLREQFTQLLLRSRGQHLRAVSTPERDERRARGGKAIAAMLAGQGDDAA